MTDEQRERARARERAARRPIDAQRDWLTATEESTGQDTLEAAIDVALGTPPIPTDDPVVNGYRGINTSATEPPGPEVGAAPGAHPH